jgi:fibronectin type 3 domain-containing protein
MSAFLAKAQIFTWKNPNFPAQDSLKTDSIVSKRLNKEFFKKDTAHFVWKEKKILYDESVFVKKNSRSQILGDLNAKGSIIENFLKKIPPILYGKKKKFSMMNRYS